MPLTLRASLDPEATASLEAVTGLFRTLEDVVRWALSGEPRRMIEEVVVQDEYTHDVVMPYADGLYLVFDTT
ncbi:MAG TPA: hypothetical protein VE093_40695 [Polyangiaceae bacterium]|jgi:hypothetical protein|nr:hypothetical protein [Polyangiaceae bacterium]